MSRGAKIGAGVLAACALLGVLIWRLAFPADAATGNVLRKEPTSVVQPAVPPVDARDPALAPALAGPDAVAAPAVPLAAPAAGGNRWVAGEVSGRVVDRDGRPLPGAHVTLLPAGVDTLSGVRFAEPDAQPSGARRIAPAVDCGPDGRFALAFDHPFVCEVEHGAKGQPWVESWDPALKVEAAGQALRVDRVGNWDGGRRDLGDLYLLPECVISGRVVDEDGQGVAAVRVTAQASYDISPKPAGTDLTLDRAATRAQLVALSEADGRFELHGGWPDTREFRARGPNAEEGYLHLPAAPWAAALDVGEIVVGPAVPMPAMVQQMRDARLAGGAAFDTRSADGSGVIGRMLDADGQPLAYTWLQAQLPSPDDKPLRRGVRTDANGAFVLRDGPAGRWRFVSQPAIEGEVDVAPGELRPVELRARRLGRLRGTVSAFGQPLAGAEVYPFLPDAGSGKWMWLTTAADGHYEFACDHGPARYEVCVQSPAGRRTDFEEFVRTVGWDEVAEIDIDLGSAGVAGRVVAAEDGAPVAGARVTLQSLATDEAWTAVAGADGLFRVGPVKPAAYRMVVSAANGRAELDVDLSDGRLLEDQRLELPRNRASLRVELAGRRGFDRFGSMLRLEAPGQETVTHDVRFPPFVLEGLQPGDWSVVLKQNRAGPDADEDAAAARRSLGTVHLVAGEQAELRLDAALFR